MELEIKTYVTENFKRVECIRYVEYVDKSDTDSNPEKLCHCGRYENEEKHSKKSGNSGEYDPAKDLILEPCNAYGEMKLTGFKSIAGRNPKYVRVGCLDREYDKLSENLYKLICEHWKIPEPQLIISLNGGAKKMIPLSSNAKLAFKTGIIKLAKNAPTWIITGGFGFGISKLVGEANYDYLISSSNKQFHVFGIGSWGAVLNRESLIRNNDVAQPTYDNVKGNTVKKGQAPLDPHHDVFLLFDGKAQREFGLEIPFRSAFEKYASKTAKCSVVQVVVEGGKKTILTGFEALNSEIPLVVMKGSKRAADIICDVIESPNKTMAEDVANSMLDEYEDEWKIKPERDYLFSVLMKMHEFYKTDMIKIFSMSDFSINLDKAILEAAFAAKTSGKNIDDISKLKLSMIYNRPDVAEEVIFDKNQINLLDHIDQVESALKKNQWQFMDLFLNHGLTVESFLTKKFLLELYDPDKLDSDLNSNVLHIYKHLLGENADSSKTLHRISKIIRKLTNNLISDKYPDCDKNRSCSCRDSDQERIAYPDKVTNFNKTKEIREVTKKSKTGCICLSSNDVTKTYEYTKYPAVNIEGEMIFTEQDLFFWALIMQRMEMAKIFWQNGKDHIGSALVASVVCKNLAAIARKEGEVEMMTNLLNHKKEIEELATNILTEAYWRDKIRTHLLLIRALPYIERTSCMEIADKNQMVDFLFHSACQTRLNSIWLGGMSPYLSTFRIILNLPFGFLTSKLLLYPFASERTKLKKTTDEFENISTNVNTTDQIRYNAAAKSKADKIKDPNKKKEYLTKFRNRQQESWKNVTFCQAVSTYYRAPITKFLMNMVSYIVFLCLFTYFTLVELQPLTKVVSAQNRMFEFMVYIYVATYVIEEIRQISFAGTPAMSAMSRVIEWISSLWNIFDVLLYVLFIIATILRHITTIDFVYARTMFSLTLSMYCFRFLQFYYAQKSLGPKVIMISRMMKDIGFFLAIYVIAVFAYGTFAQALLFPNTALSPLLLKHIVYQPYWQTYGELNIEYVTGLEPQDGRESQQNAMVVVAFALFMLFSNVLLLNLLIAMFGNTFAKVEENSNRIWAYNRYHLIEEFYYRPILPPPINIFEIIYKIMVQLCQCTGGHQKLSVDQFLVNLRNDEDIQSSGFEQQCMETYLIDHPFNVEDEKSNEKEKSALASSMPMPQDSHPEIKLQSQTSKDIGEETIKRMLGKMDDLTTKLNDMNDKLRKVRRHQKKTNQTIETKNTVASNRRFLAKEDDDDDDCDNTDGVAVMSKKERL